MYQSIKQNQTYLTRPSIYKMALASNRKNELCSKRLAYDSEKNIDSYLTPCTKLRWQMNINIEIKKEKKGKKRKERKEKASAGSGNK